MKKYTFFNIRFAIILFLAFLGFIIFLLSIAAIDENLGYNIFVRVFTLGIVQSWIIWMIGFYFLTFIFSNISKKEM